LSCWNVFRLIPIDQHQHEPFSMKNSLWLFLLTTVALHNGNLGAQATEGPDEIQDSKVVHETQVYKKVGDVRLKVLIEKPKDWQASDQRLAVVFFFGGGWVAGTPEQFRGQSEYLASRGAVCFRVTYRTIPKRASGPPLVCVQDAKSALRWVRSHAQELGIDPHKIAAAGGSAGGHLAAFAGMVSGLDDPLDDVKVSAKPNALILFNPVFDNGKTGGWGHERVGERVKEYSPAHNITAAAPPTLIFLGRKDNLIPVETVERFQAKMKAAGVRCEAIFYDDQGHGFFNKEPFKTRTLIAADKFLESLGWLTGPPTLTEPSPSVPAPGKKISPANSGTKTAS
jgi:acetyl esterase